MRIMFFILTFWAFYSPKGFAQTDEQKVFSLLKKSMDLQLPLADSFLELPKVCVKHLPLSGRDKKGFIREIGLTRKKDIKAYFQEDIRWIDFDSARFAMQSVDTASSRFIMRYRPFCFLTTPVFFKNMVIIHLIIIGRGYETFLFRKDSDVWKMIASTY